VVKLVGLEPTTRLLRNAVRVRPAPHNGAQLNLGLCRNDVRSAPSFLTRLSLAAKFGFPETENGLAETPLECRSGHGALHGGCDLRKGLACRMLELTLRRFIMALAPRDRGPRLTVPCVRCGGPSRLKSVEFAMFPNGIQQAIYECDCGGVIKRVLPSQSNQPLPTGSTVDL
jgi:hypothetical protein